MLFNVEIHCSLSVLTCQEKNMLFYMFLVWPKSVLLIASEYMLNVNCFELLLAGYFPLLMFYCPINQFWDTNSRDQIASPGVVLAVPSSAFGLPVSVGFLCFEYSDNSLKET